MDSTRAYSYLEQAILIGDLKPRERLVESDLAGRLGISRTPVREALRRLEERGLVRIHPHRGTVVADLSPDDVEGIYAVRACLEVLASGLFLRRISPASLKRVREAAAAYARLATGRDPLALMQADDRFHDAIYREAGNPCLFSVIQDLRQRINCIRFVAWSQPDRIARSVAEHHQMLRTLSTRQERRLADLTRKHLRVAKEAYLDHLSPSARGSLAERALA